jgi:hypothetical protein
VPPERGVRQKAAASQLEAEIALFVPKEFAIERKGKKRGKNFININGKFNI